MAVGTLRVMVSTSPRFALFQAAMRHDGLLQALAVLNANVTHRFTAVNVLADGMLRNHCLCDKLGKITSGLLAPIPLTHSFCQFAFRDGVFHTSDAASDPRLAGHPYQMIMLSYTGVPVTNIAGDIVGSLCHLDERPQALTDEEFELLQQAGRMIAPAMLLR